MGENKEFSDWVKRAKVATTEKGVTIVEIAEELGTATNYLYGIMSGRVFSQPMIQRVSDYLTIIASWFLPLRYPAGKERHQGAFLLFCLIRKGMQ